MTDREKLIEIKKSVSCHKDGCRFCDYSKHEHCMEELLVDHLIANGVVVREKGEWMKVNEPLGWQEVDCVECPKCHESWVIDEDYCFEDLGFWNFCPNCGADMRKVENDG